MSGRKRDVRLIARRCNVAAGAARERNQLPATHDGEATRRRDRDIAVATRFSEIHDPWDMQRARPARQSVDRYGSARSCAAGGTETCERQG